MVPGASVVITNANTGSARDTVTNGEGLYNVPALIPGTYNVKVEHAGFAATARDGVELLTGSTLSIDIQLGVAQQQQTVEVSGSAAAIEDHAVGARHVRAPDRSIGAADAQSQLVGHAVNLVPGAREVPISGGRLARPRRHVRIFRRGSRTDSNNNMLVDGVDNKDEQDGGSVMNYSLEAIQEFRAITSNFPTEYPGRHQSWSSWPRSRELTVFTDRGSFRGATNR